MNSLRLPLYFAVAIAAACGEAPPPAQPPQAAVAPQAAEPAAAAEPIVFRLAGYGPATTSFSQGMTLIGQRLTEQFSDRVDIRYVLNVLDIGYAGADLTWLVDSGLLTMAYATMSEDQIPELEIAGLPFVFGDTASARAAMDGALGDAARKTIESRFNMRVLGFFENGFRHVSNNVRPVRTPADLAGLSIRVLPMQVRTFEALGAAAPYLPLPQVREGLASGKVDGQENPFANVVTYELYPLQRYYTASYHSYLSRPIYMHRPSFDALPDDIKTALGRAVQDAVALQRRLKDEEEETALETIRAAGGEIVELTVQERQLFIDAVAPVYDVVREIYTPEQLALVGR